MWTAKEVQQLLEDIGEQFDSDVGSEYFVGTVLVSPGTEPTHFDGIDGQQRLTTFYLLLCALRLRFKASPQHHALIDKYIAISYPTSDGKLQNSNGSEGRRDS